VGAITSSDPMFSLPLELRDTLKLEYDHPMSPYDKRSRPLLEYAQGLKALPVPEKLTIEEASSLMSIWKNENVLFGGKLFSFFYIENNNEFEQFASQPIMTNSYSQNTLNLEGTLEISYGRGFYQALCLWNALCQNRHDQ
jgi:small subunit ribosomal protein S29